MQNKIEIALSSPTTWTLVGLAVFNGLTAIAPQLGGTFGNIVNVILVILAGYLHTGTVQTALTTGSIK